MASSMYIEKEDKEINKYFSRLMIKIEKLMGKQNIRFSKNVNFRDLVEFHYNEMVRNINLESPSSYFERDEYREYGLSVFEENFIEDFNRFLSKNNFNFKNFINSNEKYELEIDFKLLMRKYKSYEFDYVTFLIEEYTKFTNYKFNIDRKTKILDIGAGDCNNLIELINHYDVPIDNAQPLDPKFDFFYQKFENRSNKLIQQKKFDNLDQIKQKNSILRLNPAEYINFEESITNLDDQSVDIVLVYNIFHHLLSIKSVDLMIKEINRVLKNNGCVIIKDHDLGNVNPSLKKEYIVYIMMMHDIYYTKLYNESPDYIKLLTLEQIIDLFYRHNFLTQRQFIRFFPKSINHQESYFALFYKP